MGYESVQSGLAPMSRGHLEMRCPYGNITEVVPNGVGINLAEVKSYDTCLVVNGTNDKCSALINATVF